MAMNIVGTPFTAVICSCLMQASADFGEKYGSGDIVELWVMQAVMDMVVPYIHDRKQFGQSIGEFQLVQGKVADMYTTMQASRAFCYAVGKNLDSLGTQHVREVRKDCAAVILYCAENATRMAGDGVQILGGNGYINEYPTGRLWRDA